MWTLVSVKQFQRIPLSQKYYMGEGKEERIKSDCCMVLILPCRLTLSTESAVFVQSVSPSRKTGVVVIEIAPGFTAWFYYFCYNINYP